MARLRTLDPTLDEIEVNGHTYKATRRAVQPRIFVFNVHDETDVTDLLADGFEPVRYEAGLKDLYDGARVRAAYHIASSQNLDPDGAAALAMDEVVSESGIALTPLKGDYSVGYPAVLFAIEPPAEEGDYVLKLEVAFSTNWGVGGNTSTKGIVQLQLTYADTLGHTDTTQDHRYWDDAYQVDSNAADFSIVTPPIHMVPQAFDIGGPTYSLISASVQHHPNVGVEQLGLSGARLTIVKV